MPDPEHVLGVDRGVVRGAAGGDDDVLDVRAANARATSGPTRSGPAARKPGGDLGLLVDLVAEAHRTGPMAAAGEPAEAAAGTATRAEQRSARARRARPAGSNTSRRGDARRVGRERPTASAARRRRPVPARRRRDAPRRAGLRRLGGCRIDRADDDTAAAAAPRARDGRDLRGVGGVRDDELVHVRDGSAGAPRRARARRSTTCRPGSGRAASRHDRRAIRAAGASRQRQQAVVVADQRDRARRRSSRGERLVAGAADDVESGGDAPPPSQARSAAIRPAERRELVGVEQPPPRPRPTSAASIRAGRSASGVEQQQVDARAGGPRRRRRLAPRPGQRLHVQRVA